MSSKYSYGYMSYYINQLERQFNTRRNSTALQTQKTPSSLYLKPYSAGIDISRQNLTSVDVRFCRLKSILAL